MTMQLRDVMASLRLISDAAFDGRRRRCDGLMPCAEAMARALVALPLDVPPPRQCSRYHRRCSLHDVTSHLIYHLPTLD